MKWKACVGEPFGLGDVELEEPFGVSDVDCVQGDTGGDRGGHLGDRVECAQGPGGRQGKAARGHH